MELFGYEIKRKSSETRARSFVPPSNDGAVIEIAKDQGMGGFAATGGVIGQFIDMEGGIKTEADLVARYRTMALVPECDSAIEDIVPLDSSIGPTGYDYMVDRASVTQLGRDDQDIATYEFFNIWPSVLGDIALDAAGTDAIEEFTCTFSYSHFERTL